MSQTIENSVTSKLSESEFLSLQAELAKAQAMQALEKAKQAFAKGIDPRQVARKHPLITVGSVLAAGFVAATFAIPSKKEQELRHLERIRQAMNPAPESASTNGNGAKPIDKSWISVLLKELIQIVRPLLMAAITANIKSGGNPSPQPDPSAASPHGPDNTF